MKSSFLKKLENAKLLFISGGNTFYLLQELKRKNLLSLIFKQINQGLPFIGESAGAIILAPNIEYNKIMDNTELAPELIDYCSLGITNFYTLPHYIEFPFIETVQKTLTAYQAKLNLVPISNSEVIIMNDTSYEILK
ncbi:alpha-aspartyl dipeptidase [Tetragenococcus muriaticus PMC-11-5]|uniref:Alpha-aspartyl dipeptidase n=1 Tax=Tetragenococcus muriaticus PMC-11-5 TaxID=1302649 RepID=A0A091C618_9ENTE|nr:Type 1 glutamine amidotransferase-like domain-containing protein [Tetragenococcus muriaticus]KFN93286.1 alpha-aspartyl dipeptidase [Tetragenococcus muriaticus PMC-11-5]